ncbi:MAG TPA: PIG-L family deacetylase [Verrucomicrobiae bacterium]|nr:PIG-L family deacetylase [Verrucomicrobiae bacterium]
MTPYHDLVGKYIKLLEDGRALPLGGFEPTPRPALGPNAPRALFFAPHPDDECISGGIALRLMREAGFKIINVAVTLGSKKERQAARLAELRNACDYLGFDLLPTGPSGLDRINTKARQTDPKHWAQCVQVIRDIIESHHPTVLIFPHDRDWNSTHIGTHFLVMDALEKMPPWFQCYLAETEFWGAMTNPNLMVEISAENLAEMIAATTFHVGEVQRNPYHLSLPAWMIDNVRRGSEVAGGQGGAAPNYAFAALYRLRRWAGGSPKKLFAGGKQLPSSANVGELFTK